MLEPHADRVTWDAPLHSLADIEALERQPQAINSKPSRFGSLRELFAVYEHCDRERDRDLRRRPGRARARPRPDPVPGLALPPRHPERHRPLRLQRPGGPRRACPTSPAGPGAVGDRLSLGRVSRFGARAIGAPNSAVRLASMPAAERDGGDRCQRSLRRRAQRADRERVRRPRSSTSALAVYYDAETLPRLAAFFYRQAVEERNHAMMMVQYLLDADQRGADPRHRGAADRLRRRRRPGRAGARPGEAGHRADQRARSSSPATRATTRAEQFMQWFVKEQVEEVSIDVRPAQRRRARRATTRCWPRSTWRARRSARSGADPTAPAAAGGAL